LFAHQLLTYTRILIAEFVSNLEADKSGGNKTRHHT
jgi:hypothetical protein